MPGPGSRNFRLLHTLGIDTVNMPNNSSGDLKAGDAVYISSGTMAEVADSNTTGIHGILADDADSGDVAVLYVAGIFEVTTAASMNFAPGEALYCASASTVDTGTAGDAVIGAVVNEDPADGATTVDFLLHSLFFKAAVTQ